jgi:DNA-binding CsgD family transcriptional regulator/GAF domain-containing protein
MLRQAAQRDHPSLEGYVESLPRGMARRPNRRSITRMATAVVSAKQVAAETAIAEVCAQGHPALDLFAHVAKRVRRVVPYDAACWKPTDPETLLFTGFAIEDPEPGRLAAVRWRFIDNELLEPDVAKFRDLAGQPRPVTTLHRATHGEPERSRRYREIHRTLGFGAELRAVFRNGSACWGSVALVRDEGAPDFNRNEIAFIARVSDHIAAGLRVAMLLRAAAEVTDPSAPGMLVLRDDLSIESLTPQAEAWLERLPRDRGTALPLPAVVCAVARHARAATGTGGSRGPARATVPVKDGRWLTVHAAPLSDRGGTGRIAIVLAPADALELTPLRLELHGLSKREQDVVRLLARGLSTDEIAQRLWISRHTVKDHAKAVYAKLEVANRHELTAKLFFDDHLPSFDATSVREFSPAPTTS